MGYRRKWFVSFVLPAYFYSTMTLKHDPKLQTYDKENGKLNSRRLWRCDESSQSEKTSSQFSGSLIVLIWYRMRSRLKKPQQGML